MEAFIILVLLAIPALLVLSLVLAVRAGMRARNAERLVEALRKKVDRLASDSPPIAAPSAADQAPASPAGAAFLLLGMAKAEEGLGKSRSCSLPLRRTRR